MLSRSTSSEESTGAGKSLSKFTYYMALVGGRGPHCRLLEHSSQGNKATATVFYDPDLETTYHDLPHPVRDPGQSLVQSEGDRTLVQEGPSH
jgi:hypothetical protein